MKYRLARDKYNWIVQEFSPGGGVIERGKFKGNIKQDKWMDVGYFNLPKDAILYIYTRTLGEEFDATGNMLEAIKTAYDKLTVQVNELLQGKINASN
jgi:hypothetical protein